MLVAALIDLGVPKEPIFEALASLPLCDYHVGVSEATRSTLRLADEHKLTSLAFPALGTGVGGFPLDEAAKAMLTALLRHLAAGPTSLQKIVFVLYQDDAYRVFKETLASLTAK